MNGTFNPTYSSNSIWRDEDDTRCLTLDIEDIESDITALETGKADANHTHTGYASTSHTHTEYALTDHTHTGYATVDHTHTGYASAADVTALQNLVGDTAVSTQISTAIAGKVDAVAGKGLSSNDYTTAEKTKLAGIEAGAKNITVDSALSSTSTNPVQNKVVKAALDGKANSSHVHNVFSSLTDIGITTFPTTMKIISETMPANSMIVIDTRRVNGTHETYSTQTISDWGTTLNGNAIICKGVTTARITMLIMYCTTAATDAQLVYGNYAHDADRVNWDDLDVQLNSKVDKIKTYSAVDLNNLTTSGLYYVSSETTALHCPVGSNGHILVMSDGTRVRQVFFRVGTVDTNNFQWYSRSLGSDTTAGDNGWSQWWILSGFEKVWNGGTVLNSEINIGSRYGCTSWVVVARLQNTGSLASVVIPRAFLTTDTTLYKFQIADETAYISFYIYYKASDDNVYLKVVDQTNSEYTTLKYVYRVS